MGCPSGDQIARFLAGELSRDEVREVDAHIDRCSSCFSVIGLLARRASNEDATVRLRPEGANIVARDPATPGDPTITGRRRPSELPVLLRPGARFDHYEVIDGLGQGGMGVVVLARDMQLGRLVAIKVLHAKIAGSDSGAARARLIREAQATAHLSHRNVITVHGVGTVAGEVYVAMEYLPGGSVRSWLRAQPRSWRDILNVFTQAGEGLEAAHRAGFVHRDFKPDNILIGPDGRVVVTDFGLVSSGEDTAPWNRLGAEPLIDADQATLTVTGVILGTPGYMAPEQHVGGTVDARADQFAFGVALYEALHGSRPFAGQNYSELVANVCAGRISEAPHRSIPGWILPIVRRTLSVEPGHRFASMAGVLDALRLAPRAGRRTRTAIGIALTLSAIGAVVIGANVIRAKTTPPPPSCASGSELLAGVWDDRVRALVRVVTPARASMAGSRRVAEASSVLDRYATEWATIRIEACEAAQVHHTESPEQFQIRVACLNQRLGALQAAALALVHASDDASLAISSSMGSALPALADCRSVETARRVGLAPSPSPTGTTPVARAATNPADAVVTSDGATSRAIPTSATQPGAKHRPRPGPVRTPPPDRPAVPTSGSPRQHRNAAASNGSGSAAPSEDGVLYPW